MKFLMNLLVKSMAVFVTAYLLPGVKVADFWTAVMVAIVLGLVNMVIRPIILLLTLPINLLTLGLFTFIINALMILLVSNLVAGFEVKSLGWALFFSLVLSMVSSFLNALT